MLLLLRRETPDYLWSLVTEQPEPKPGRLQVDGQQRVCERESQQTWKRSKRLIEVWNGLQQYIVDTAAVSEWRKRLRACVHA